MSDDPPPDQRLRDAWLDELWKPCRELSKGDRWDKREEDRKEQRRMEEQRVSAGLPPDSPGLSPGCAENGSEIGPLRGTECA